MQRSEGRRSEQSSGDTWWDTVLANLEDAGLIATPPPLGAWPGAFPPPTPPALWSFVGTAVSMSPKTQLLGPAQRWLALSPCIYSQPLANR